MATGWREETCVTARDHRERVATHYSERNPKPLPRRFKEQSEHATTRVTEPNSAKMVRSPARPGSVATKKDRRTQGSHKRQQTGNGPYVARLPLLGSWRPTI